MTVEHVRTSPARRPSVAVPARVGTPATPYPPTQRTASPDGPLCLVVPEIGEGDSSGLVRTLRRRDSTRAILLTRAAGRRELAVLLGAGVRGAVAVEAPAARTPERSADRTPVPAPAPTTRPGSELTARELGVLRLVADGRSNRQIGEDLALSALTVKSHLARISRKVGTGDRAEMVAYAIRNDLLH
ncbi:MAG TPA: helix-turn-helix transcriptional regulator [Actinotalea sp.]